MSAWRPSRSGRSAWKSWSSSSRSSIACIRPMLAQRHQVHVAQFTPKRMLERSGKTWTRRATRATGRRPSSWACAACRRSAMRCGLRADAAGAAGTSRVCSSSRPSWLFVGYVFPGIWLDQQDQGAPEEHPQVAAGRDRSADDQRRGRPRLRPGAAARGDKWDNELSREFHRVLREMRLGKPRAMR